MLLNKFDDFTLGKNDADKIAKSVAAHTERCCKAITAIINSTVITFEG